MYNKIKEIIDSYIIMYKLKNPLNKLTCKESYEMLYIYENINNISRNTIKFSICEYNSSSYYYKNGYKYKFEKNFKIDRVGSIDELTKLIMEQL